MSKMVWPTREHVLPRQRLARPALALDRPHRDFLVGEALVQQHADDVGLEAEAARVGMPAHHVVAQVDGKTVVVVQAKPADQVDQSRIGIGQEPPVQRSCPRCVT